MAVFYNQATLSYNGNVTSSNIITGEIIETLTVSKNAVIDTYSTENDIVFVISIVNTGNTEYTDLTVTDSLGEYTVEGTDVQAVPLTYEEGSVNYYINGVQQTAPEVTATNPLTVEGIRVPANSNAIIIYAVRVNQFAPLDTDSSIINTATVAGTGICSPIEASETVTPNNSADLTISKSLAPTEVAENGELTYSFIIQNYGNTPATVDDSVIFSDTFDPVLAPIEVTFNGEEWVDGVNYDYSPVTGEFTSTEGQITVPSAQFIQNAETGAWSIQPGVSTLVITGNITCGDISSTEERSHKKSKK